MNDFLKDKLHLLKFVYDNINNLDLTDDIKLQIKDIFTYFKDFLKVTKLDKREVNKLSRYLDIINTYNTKEILLYGNKILTNAQTIYSR